MIRFRHLGSYEPAISTINGRGRGYADNGVWGFARGADFCYEAQIGVISGLAQMYQYTDIRGNEPTRTEPGFETGI
jgi:hypothetical protein